jgi:superfamily II DNA or RNA helicase
MKIIDNINSLFGEDLKSSLKSGSKLKIAASCFSMYAYEALKNELSKIDSMEFVFTAPAFIPNEASDKQNKEHREFYIPKATRERSLYGTDFEIQLRNQLTQRAIARECAEWLRKKATFRSNKTNAMMQQFACISKGAEEVVYLPLHGFSAVDLGYQQGNAVSNIVNRFDEPSFTNTYLQLFDQIWNDSDNLQDITDLICDHMSSVYHENSPERIYFLILYNIFSEFLEDINADVLPNDLTGFQNSLIWNKLFNFQKDAATGIINKLEMYNGCILADSVGLGKTFTALAVVKYYELRNKSVLVLCPKKLTDNWRNYNTNLTTNIFLQDRFNYDVFCHTDLSRTNGESFGISLNRINWGNYDLVVIDESHNFRNNEAFKERETRYQKLMNKVIRAGVKTKVLMLSATPVNNKFSDLRNQLALAYEGESENLQNKLHISKSIEEVFRRAQAVFNAWSKLPVQERTARAILDALDFDFFEILDSVTIARSRKHIQTFYNTEEIGRFPERRAPISIRCPLTNRKDVFAFNEIFNQLSLLKLAVYAPLSYLLPSRRKKYESLYDTETLLHGTLKQSDRERSLQALMTTNLLKRLESSVEAFRLTLRSLNRTLSVTLDVIEKYEKSGQCGSIKNYTESFENIDPDDDDELSAFDDMMVGGKIQINLSDMDVESWKYDLNADYTIITTILESMEKVKPEDDVKLQNVMQLLLSKLENPINPENKKILLFTAFSDTARYLYNNIAEFISVKKGLHTGIVTGTDLPKSTLKNRYDFQGILTLFSPRSKEKNLVMPQETGEIDILIGTDCISEGQNLQDCDYLINYDIHWNPVRIIQRFGRIDRIGSKNESIQLVNYWPDISLDEYINLKERVENRMVIADVSATGDDNVLTAQSNDMAYRKEQLRKLQEEVIDLEDLKTGVSITDLGLNDFRMDLINYVKNQGNLDTVPKGMHAVIPAQEEMGLKPGVIFTLRNRNDGVNINKQNRVHPYYMVYISNDGEILGNHFDIKRLLDMARASCRGRSEPIADICRIFNEKTDDGRNMKACSDLLSTAIRSMIDIKDEKDIDSLFSPGKTTALVNTIKGLDDFELIAFLVVEKGVR